MYVCMQVCMYVYNVSAHGIWTGSFTKHSPAFGVNISSSVCFIWCEYLIVGVL